MFYKALEGNTEISRHKRLGEACSDAAQGPGCRRVVSVKYEGTALKVIHEYTSAEMEEELQKRSFGAGRKNIRSNSRNQ
jgi:hypothetical protein